MYSLYSKQLRLCACLIGWLKESQSKGHENIVVAKIDSIFRKLKVIYSPCWIITDKIILFEHSFKARSHCTNGYKEDVKCKKKSCHPLENAMHPLCTHCIRVSYALSIEHPSTVISSAQKVLSCTKLLERMNFPPCTM